MTKIRDAADKAAVNRSPQEQAADLEAVRENHEAVCTGEIPVTTETVTVEPEVEETQEPEQEPEQEPVKEDKKHADKKHHGHKHK